jgi:hypothetical protein
VTGPKTSLHQCSCCDYLTLSSRGEYDICPVCFWEDDGLDITRLDTHSGPNHMTLREGRENFRRIGACDEAMLAHVLPEAKRDRFARIPR